MGKARAEIEITASESKLAAGLARARSRFQAFSTSIARGMGNAMSSAWSGVKMANKKLGLGETGRHAVGEFGGAMLTRGVDAFADAANGVRDFERDLIRLGIAGDLPTEKLNALRTAIRKVSGETGVASSEILRGTQTYVDLTGDIEGAMNAQRSFARIAQASGAQVADVATASAALREGMHLDSGQIEAAFSGLIVQGKAGAVSVRDFAGELAELAPQFAQFAGAQGVDGVLEMGAAFQIVRKGAGSAGMAATQTASLIRALSDSETIKKLGKLGINVLDDKGKLRGFTAILTEIAKHPAFDRATTLGDVFGRAEAQNGVRTLRNNVSELERMVSIGRDAGAVQRDMTTFLESDAGRIDAAFNRVKETIALAFTPARITAFTNAVEGLVAKLGPVVDAVGAIGSGFGKLYGVGQSIRGALSGEVNPWATSSADLRDRLMAINEESDPARKEGKAAGLAFRLANQKTFATARDSILGAEINERSSPESIRRAVEARFTRAEPGTFGALGTQEAGRLYLQNAGIDDKKAAEMFGQNLEKAFTEMGDKIVKAIAASQPKIEIPTAKIAAGAAAGSSNAALGGPR